MANLLRSAPLALLAFTGLAHAQAPENAAVSQALPETAYATSDGVPGQLDVNGVYTVAPGDTLWDLSQQFLSNPWYWPKIWADNPYVDNPHWIYPGNKLRIRSTGEGLPPEVTVEEDVQEPEDVLAQRPAEVADFSTGSVHDTDSLGQASDLVSVAGRGHIALAPPGKLRTRLSSLVTSRELAQMGTIDASFEQKELLSSFDRVYVRFAEGQKTRVGDRFSIFRAGDEVRHPVTGASWGHQTRLMGSLRVVGIEKGVAIAEIGEVNDYILRDDRIGPAAALDKVVSAVANERNVAGFVLATEIPDQEEIGESHIVFIDQGTQAGVVEGNTFTVMQSGDGLDRLALGRTVRKHDDRFPLEPVATLVVFDVRDNASAALVVKSLREIKVGDVARMVVSSSTGTGGD